LGVRLAPHLILPVADHDLTIRSMATLTTRLYLVRHAVAEEPAAGVADEARRLTKRGRKRFARLVRQLTGAGMDIDLVATSPLIRARQTAEILAANMPGAPRVDVVDGLVSLAIGDGTAAVRMHKGAIACVRLDDGPGLAGELDWLATTDLVDDD